MWPRRRSSISSSISRPMLPRLDPHRREAAAAGPQEPALERVQVHRAGQGHARGPHRRRRMEPRQRGARAAQGAAIAFCGPRHRHRHLRRTSSRSSSRRSSRPTAARAASTAARASASRSAARSRAARRRDPRSSSAAGPRAARSRSTCRTSTQRPPRARAACGPHASADAAPSSVHVPALALRRVRRSSTRRPILPARHRRRSDGASGPAIDRCSSWRTISPSRASCSRSRASTGSRRIVAHRGAEALSRVRELRPSAITLDINLPDIDGWRVLDRLKHDLGLRHIPVQVITTDGRSASARSGWGRAACSRSRSRRETRSDDAIERLVGFLDARRRTHPPGRARSGGARAETRAPARRRRRHPRRDHVPRGIALALSEGGRPDVVVTGLDLPDGARPRARRARRGDAAPCRTCRSSCTRRTAPRRATRSGSSGSDEPRVLEHGRSAERLVDEVALFLHRTRRRPVSRAPQGPRAAPHRRPRCSRARRVLIVDDDIRNIFAMTTILEEHEHGHASRRRPAAPRSRCSSRRRTSTSC